MAHLILIGMRGVGKSTVGAIVAERCGRPFIDLDDVVLRRCGAVSVRDVFATGGESVWRAGEAAALESLLDAPLAPSVIALGGGAPMVERIADRLRQARAASAVIVVHLACAVDVAAARLDRSPGDRASITGRGIGAELAELATLRTPRYVELADFTVSGDGEPLAVAASVATAIVA